MAIDSSITQPTSAVDLFLASHRLRASDFDIQTVVDAFWAEMELGLAGKESSLRMIPTYIEADNEFITDEPVVAIDAGGTNFRTTLVKFGAEGKLELQYIKHNRMPGIDREIGKAEFFSTMADYIKDFIPHADRIGFCFSYATEILPNRDGVLIEFSKEVKAPEVEGERIGENLLAALGTPHKQIVLLNDTVATLLAGKSSSYGKNYDSFIGFILGTGMNICYIESNKNITKVPALNPAKSQIINVESGNFDKMPRTDIDYYFEETTNNPGSYSFEKMISGAYFGGISLAALKQAAKEEVFTASAAKDILDITELTSEQVNQFLRGEPNPNHLLYQCLPDPRDENNARIIIQTLVSRGAKLVAGNMAAVLLKTSKGLRPDRPILTTIEGTTFYKLYQFKQEFEKELAHYLQGERQRYYEFIQVPSSSLVGAALAALIH